MKKLFPLIVIILAFFGCSKDEEPVVTPVPSEKIKSIMLDSILMAEYEYDDLGRTIMEKKLVPSAGYDSSLFIYGSDSVTIVKFRNGMLAEIWKGTHSNGNLLSMGGSTPDSSAVWHTTYTYNAEGYLVSEVQTDANSVPVMSRSNILVGGNVLTSEMVQSGVTLTMVNQYYTDKENSVGFPDFAVTYKGKGSDNLVKRSVITSYGIAIITDYTYEFDTYGRVTLMTIAAYGESMTLQFNYF